MKLLVKRHHFLEFKLRGRRQVDFLLASSDSVEQVGNLVRVLARSRHLNRASPVEVEMAQGEGQLLDFLLSQV